VEEELFLLALWTENPTRPSDSYYARDLRDYYDTNVTLQYIGKWFHSRFNFSGSFCRPNLVPKDKFWQENIVRYMEFCMVLEQLPICTKFHWLDEKHMLNKDVEPTKVRADPLTGYINGDFHDLYNLFAIISVNPQKLRPVAYYIVGREDNGNAAFFLTFVEFLLQNSWFEYGNVLVVDNASIHTGGEADIVENLIWHAMQVLVVFPPTRSPELNPIELIFHILAWRIRPYRYWQLAGPCNQAVIDLTRQEVLVEILFNIVIQCCTHCGY
jgi:transposase